MVTKHTDTAIRRKQIVAAARKLIAKYGSEHLTVRRIAKEIGVSEGAIYRHFKSKREILSFLVDEIEKLLISDIRKSSEGNLNTLNTLEKVIAAHISGVERRNGMSFQIIAEIISLGDKKLNKRVSDIIQNYIAAIKEVLVRGVSAGLIRDDIDLDAAATMFFGFIQGVVNMWALDHFSFDLESKYASIWALYSRAIIRPESEKLAVSTTGGGV